MEINIPKNYKRSDKKILNFHLKSTLILCKIALNFFDIKKEFENTLKIHKKKTILDIMGRSSPALNIKKFTKKFLIEKSPKYLKVAKIIQPKINIVKKIKKVDDAIVLINYEFFNYNLDYKFLKLIKKNSNIIYVYKYIKDNNQTLIYNDPILGCMNTHNCNLRFKFFLKFLHSNYIKTETKNIIFYQILHDTI